MNGEIYEATHCVIVLLFMLISLCSSSSYQNSAVKHHENVTFRGIRQNAYFCVTLRNMQPCVK